MTTFISSQSWLILMLIFAASLYLLSKATDHLVDHAVTLSRQFGVSELLIGATIVSLGTTLPELATSVVALINGTTDFALGNAIGSVVTNTTLVLGVGSLAGSMPVAKTTASRLPFLIGPILLMIVASKYPFEQHFFSAGQIHPLIGVTLLLGLVLYMRLSFRKPAGKAEQKEKAVEPNQPTALFLKEGLIIFISAVGVAASASILVSTVETAASRLGVSEAVIAGTVVALGTSLPELSTTYASVKKGYGGLAVGNIIGANSLNLLLVLGVSIAFSPAGLGVPTIFYQLHFPLAVIVIGMLTYFIFNTKKLVISKREGLILLVVYFIYLLLNLVL